MLGVHLMLQDSVTLMTLVILTYFGLKLLKTQRQLLQQMTSTSLVYILKIILGTTLKSLTPMSSKQLLMMMQKTFTTVYA